MLIDPQASPDRADQGKGIFPIVGADEDARGVPIGLDDETAGALADKAGANAQPVSKDPLADTGLGSEGGSLTDDEQAHRGQSDDAADRRHKMGDLLALVEGGLKPPAGIVWTRVRTWCHWVHAISVATRRPKINI